jgi:microcystin-dependent protein
MALPPAGYISDPARTESEMKTALEAVRDALASLTGASAPETLTLVSGAVTPTQGDLTVDTEGGAATDDLTHILPTNLHDGALIYVRTTDPARDVTLKHQVGGTGQISLRDAADLLLTEPREWVQLRLVGALWQEVERSALATTPAGSIFSFAGSVLPPGGYLWCDGALVARATYPALFAVLGTTYGAGDGATTFGLPNLKGRVPVGRDAAQAEFAALNQTGGVKTHILSVAEMPVHAHPLSDPTHAHTVYDPGHAHGISDPGHTHLTVIGTATPGAGSQWYPSSGPVENRPTVAAGTGISINGAAAGVSIYAAGTGISLGNNGSGAAHNNLAPYLTLNFIIKT